MTQTVKKIVRGVPADLQTEIRAAVDRDATNMNDLVVGILARKFSVPFAPTGRRSAAVGDDGYATLLLRMPKALRRKINLRAETLEQSHQDLILSVLADHFAAADVRRPVPARG